MGDSVIGSVMSECHITVSYCTFTSSDVARMFTSHTHTHTKLYSEFSDH